jgi:hypothetical protein
MSLITNRNVAPTPGVQKSPRCFGSEVLDSLPVASGEYIAFGALLVDGSNTVGVNTVKAAKCASVGGTPQQPVGVADIRKFVTLGKYDGFWSDTPRVEIVPIVTERANVFVTPNGANISIEAQDYLEVAVLGDGSTSNHGVLEEAGAADGTLLTADTVAKALETVTMGSSAYAIPASDVAVGASTITMAAGAIATMGLQVGMYILLEDLNGAVQMNKVADLSSTVITLVMPSTVALVHNNSDLVTRVFQVRAELRF